jgi:predicted PurR-regulated permease PerM
VLGRQGALAEGNARPAGWTLYSNMGNSPAAPGSPAAQPPPMRVRWGFTIVVAVIALAILYWIRDVIFITFFGVLAGILTTYLADLGVRLVRLPRTLAAIAATVLLFLVVAALVAVLAIPLAAQASRLIEALPRYVADIEAWLENLRRAHPGLERILPAGGPEAGPGLAGQVSKAAITALGVAVRAFDAAVDVVAIFFLGLFFALEPDRYVRGAAALWPGSDVAQVWLLYRIGRALRAWLLATGIDMAVVAGLWTVGLWAAGVDYFLVFGIVGGFFQIIPYFGPFFTFLPPLFIALGKGAESAAAVTSVYLAIQLFDSYILLPWLLEARLDLPPATVIVAVLALGSAFGFWGTILSVPILTVIHVVANEIYLRPQEETLPAREPPPIVPPEEGRAGAAPQPA